ncbi:MAG: DUF899 domain-containing protein [Myxococcota bacterium]|nr:DUF899 domain-containing protein [Myxococcota bacterium]
MNTSKPVVSREQWTVARKALLEKEKAFTRERDALAAERRKLPMVRVEKQYVFVDASGEHTLAALFGAKPQLLVYHFMLEPGWKEGCTGCSYVADHFDGSLAHLSQRDTALVAVSRAPLAAIEAFKKRMGWKFRWLSSAGTDFNYDFAASFRPEDIGNEAIAVNYAGPPVDDSPIPGLSAFLADRGQVFHTYSTYKRGLDAIMNTYNLLDLTPLGRHEEGLAFPMAWVRHHDKYRSA